MRRSRACSVLGLMLVLGSAAAADDNEPIPIDISGIPRRDEAFLPTQNVPIPARPTVQGSDHPAAPVPDQPAVPTPARPATPVPDQPAVPTPARPAVPIPARPSTPVPDQPAVPTPARPAVPIPARPSTPVPDQPAVPVPARPAAPIPDQPAAPVPSQPAAPIAPQPSVPAPDQPTVPPATAPDAGLLQPSPIQQPFSFGPSEVTPDMMTGGAGLTSASGFSRGGIPQMLGDQGPFLPVRARQVPGNPRPPGVPPPFPPGPPPPPPNPRQASSLAPSVRGFKIAENQSPRPQDRFFYTFNYFSQLNRAVNDAFDVPVKSLRVYRHIFGFEKTFDEARGSFGLRLPLNTLTADSAISGNFARPGGTDTALGDLSIFTKYILKQDPETGSLMSAGLVVKPPTSGSRFAGATYLQSIQTTTVEPFFGYIWARGDFYVHGFSSIGVPMNPADVTIAYNDVGMGYFLLRRNEPRGGLAINAVTPTFEVHVNTPLNHRGAFNSRDISGTSNVVNLTSGVNFEIGRSSLLTFGFVTPVTSPKPFDYEAVILFNVRFGASRRGPTGLPPIIGG